MPPKPPSIRFAAVGDLLLDTPPPGVPYPRSPQLIGADVRELFQQCDLVFGNLECTFPGNDGQVVPAEPRVFTTPAIVQAVQTAGFDVVTLANNHAFDAFEAGFLKLRSLLDEMELPHFGAGMNADEAVAPYCIEVNGIRLAFVGAVDERSGPFQFATETAWGVAPLEVDRLVRQIRDLKQQVDHVIVSVHWGEERFLVPAPEQIEQARSFVDAGASMVLGHHPHVLQGMEIYQDAPIIYSLGNFIADEVFFTNGDAVRWNRVGRTGCILVTELTSNELASVEQIATYDDGKEVAIDQGKFGHRRIGRTNHAIAGGVSPRRYQREQMWVKVARPTIDHLRPSKLKNLRPRHFRNALRMLTGLRYFK